MAIIDREAGETTDKSALDINDIVQPRAGEIAANIINQITTAGLKITDLGAGIIITGGAAALTNFDLLIKKQCGLEVRHASADHSDIVIRNPYIKASDHIDVISLMLYAARNFSDDCLETPAETAPQAYAEPQETPFQQSPTSPGRRQPDEETLLQDDDDERAAKDAARKRARAEKERRQQPADSDAGNEYADGTDIDDDDTRKRLNLLERLGRKVTNFFTAAPDDDMD